MEGRDHIRSDGIQPPMIILSDFFLFTGFFVFYRKRALLSFFSQKAIDGFTGNILEKVGDLLISLNPVLNRSDPFRRNTNHFSLIIDASGQIIRDVFVIFLVFAVFLSGALRYLIPIPSTKGRKQDLFSVLFQTFFNFSNPIRFVASLLTSFPDQP
jgi:hypothetical protein